MQLYKLALALGTAALGIASAASQYHVTFSETAIVGGVELKAGDYKLVLDGDMLTIWSGKDSTAVPVKVQTAAGKFARNTVRYSNGDGKYRVDEIRLGGTNTTLIVPLQGAEASRAGSGRSKSARVSGGAQSSTSN
jgi:hypothetical protein